MLFAQEYGAVQRRSGASLISSLRSFSHSFPRWMNTDRSTPSHRSERTDHGTNPLWAAPRVRTRSSCRSPCWWHKPVANCRSRGCLDTACMACALSRVWCRDTAPLCSREVQALWAPSHRSDLTYPGRSQAQSGPAAGRILEKFPEVLVNNNHKIPGTEPVPGTGPERAERLACRWVGGLSWSLWEGD